MKGIVKKDKGQAGLTIFLSLCVLLFVIGLLVAIFALMGAELQGATYDTTTATKTNESVTKMSEVNSNLVGYGYRSGVCTVSGCVNHTEGQIISSGNYTATNCQIKASGGAGNVYINDTWLCTYSVVYSNDNLATDVMNDTVTSLSSSSDFFDIFIVIGSMVVLILLTVLIISAIRGSGLIGGGESTSAGTYQGHA